VIASKGACSASRSTRSRSFRSRYEMIYGRRSTTSIS
jgi:hypothetical protein